MKLAIISVFYCSVSYSINYMKAKWLKSTRMLKALNVYLNKLSFFGLLTYSGRLLD